MTYQPHWRNISLHSWPNYATSLRYTVNSTVSDCPPPKFRGSLSPLQDKLYVVHPSEIARLFRKKNWEDYGPLKDRLRLFHIQKCCDYDMFDLDDEFLKARDDEILAGDAGVAAAYMRKRTKLVPGMPTQTDYRTPDLSAYQKKRHDEKRREAKRTLQSLGAFDEAFSKLGL